MLEFIPTRKNDGQTYYRVTHLQERYGERPERARVGR
jgi:hypothetical protein